MFLSLPQAPPVTLALALELPEYLLTLKKGWYSSSLHEHLLAQSQVPLIITDRACSLNGLKRNVTTWGKKFQLQTLLITATILEMQGGDIDGEWQNPAPWLSAGETVPGGGRAWGNLGDVLRYLPSEHSSQVSHCVTAQVIPQYRQTHQSFSSN